MKQSGVKKLISALISASLIVGNMANFEVDAKEEPVTWEVIEKVQEPSGGVRPAEIQLISKEEAEELQKAFVERQGEGEYGEPAINSGYSSAYGYSTLKTAEQQTCYNELKAAAYSFHEEYKEAVQKTNNSGTYHIWEAFDLEQYKFTDVVDVQQVLFALEADCPELFWLTGNFSWGINSQNVITNFYPAISEDYVEVESRKTTQAAIEAGIIPYLKAIDTAKVEGKSDMQLELMIHDMIIEAIDYAYDSTGAPQEAGYAHSIEGVFGGMGAVCEGYAKAFQLLANYADLESIYAVGYGDGGGHAWNLVCLDGEWYNLDVTWDDLKSSDYHDGVRYLYYNCDTASFGAHEYVPSVFAGMYQVPDTNQDAYNYYKYYDLYVTEEDVAGQDAFTAFLENAISRCGERNDYLLQLYSADSTVHETLLSMVSRYAGSVLTEVSTTQNIYKNAGSYFYSTSNGYLVYYPMVRIYADNYEVAYNEQGAQLVVHMVKGRNEILQEGNYTVSYSGNDQPGTAQAFVSGVGDYTTLGTSVLEFCVLEDGEVDVTPTVTPYPTTTAIPTEEPDNTQIPTPEVTVTKQPSATPEAEVTTTPEVTAEPDITLAPSATPEPDETSVPSATPKPEATLTPSVTRQPAEPVLTTTLVPSQQAEQEDTAPTQVIGVKFVSATNAKVTISFKKQQGVSGYEISLMKGNRQVKSAVTTKNKYTFQKLSAGTDYKVKVRAFSGNSNQKIYGQYSNTVKVATATKAPSIRQAKMKKNQALVQWKKVKNANGYEVYMSGKKNKGYKKIATISKASTVKYTKKKLTAGKTYYFKMRTYRKVGGKKVYSSYSKPVKCK